MMARVTLLVVAILAGGCGQAMAPFTNLGFEIHCGDGQAACG